MQLITKKIYLAVKEYQISQISMAQISQKYDVDRHTISKYKNFDLKDWIEKDDVFILFDKKEIEAIDYYKKEKCPVSEITKKFGYKQETFLKKLKYMNVEYTRFVKNSYDRSYFETIDTQKKAYILGFILADGYITPNGDSLRIKVSKKDIDVLYKICDEIGYNKNNIRPERNAITGNIAMVLDLSSKQMICDLNKLDIYNAKSTKEIPYYDISPNLKSHYVRGILDGDGHIRKNGWGFGFCGSQEVMQYIVDFFCERPVGGDIKKEGKLYRLSYSSKARCKKLLDILYDDANIFLDRKYLLYKNLFCN